MADFSYARLQLLNRIARHLASAENVRGALDQVLDWLEEVCQMRRGVITLLNQEEDELLADSVVAGIGQQQRGKMRYRPGEGVTGQVFATGEPVFIPVLDAGNAFLDRGGLRRGLDRGNLSFYCVPIIYRKDVIGTLSADREVDTDASASALELEFLREVAQLLAPFVQRRRLEDQMEIFRRLREPGSVEFLPLVGRSSALEEVQKLISQVADSNTTVLITGETGTGKGLAAELIHRLSPRQKQPFVEVNCGAIPENLVESELFGHEKGAFTGAFRQRIGVLERAAGGTVFLDEIGELPPALQTRLLRVLQTRRFERLGGSKTLNFNGRVVAATNRDPEAEVSRGNLREDLYYRLNVFPICMPALRERGRADIMLLADHFVKRFATDMRKQIFRIDTPAIDMLTAYHWPGNVRELENVIERAVLLADGDVVHGHHLPPSLQMNKYSERAEDHGDFETKVRNFEIELITEALKDTGGNQARAAEKLGITKRIIQYKISKYGLDCRRFRTG